MGPHFVRPGGNLRSSSISNVYRLGLIAAQENPMGPFPHDAPPPAICDQNPMGTDGFEFVEFCHPRPDELDRLFRVMGFAAVAKHRSKNVTLYRQGDINFILNAEPGSFAATFAEKHG